MAYRRGATTVIDDQVGSLLSAGGVENCYDSSGASFPVKGSLLRFGACFDFANGLGDTVDVDEV